MPVTATPIFGQTPKLAQGVVTAANTTLTSSPDDVVTMFTAGANGAIVTKASLIPRETTTAGVGYLYISTDAGANKIMVDAVAVAADTLTTTDAPTRVDFSIASETVPYRIPASAVVYFGYSIALSTAGCACNIAYMDF